MKAEINAEPPRTAPASARGDRLYPPRSSRLYWVLSQLRETYSRLIGEFVPESNQLDLVDYGCGNTPYRSLFGNVKYTACDFPGNELADVLLEGIGALPLEDSSADIVLSSQVLEHVFDVNFYLSEARRVLRPDGLLFLSTHGLWRYHPDPCDYWRWTSDGLKRIVEDSRFKIVSFTGVVSAEAAAIQLWQDSVSDRVPGRLRNLFHRFVQWRMKCADMRCSVERRNLEASVYVVVAKKV